MRLEAKNPSKAAFLLPALLAAMAVLALSGLLALVAAPPAHADEADSQTVRVGYYENEVFEEGAQPGAVKTGYAYEYYRKLSEYTGWEYDYVYGDYSELYQMLLDGKIDLLAGLAFKEDRVGLIAYPETAMGSETYSLVKHDSDASITADPATLSGKSIGVLDSAMVSVLDSFLKSHAVSAEVVTFSDYEALFAAFDGHDVDVLAAEGDGAYGRDNAEVVCAFGSSDYYLCVSISRPDLLAELNAAQAELLADEPNYISSLRSKYYQVSVSSRAFSPAEREWLETHDTLRVGYLNNYLPYSDTDESGNATGIVVEIVPKMLGDLGVTGLTVTFSGFASYDNMIAAMDEGGIDVAFPVGGGLYYSEENGIYQSSPVTSSSTELVYKGAYTDDLVTHFAVNENNRMQYYYVKMYFPDAKITLYPSIDACLDAVLAGEAGCTTLNGLRANEILRNGKYDDLQLRQLAHGDDRCFGVQIGNEGLLKLLNRGINVIGEDYAQNLAYRYTGGLYAYTLLDLLRDHTALFAGILIVIVGLVIFFLVRDSQRSKQQVAAKESARLELEEKNRELAKSQEALSDALEAAEHANRAKTVFLNNMSHDIRTPMNAIVGFTALASTHLDDTERVRDYLNKIHVSSHHLLSLINDVLDMSRIESGKMTIEDGEVHLPSLIDDVRSIIQADAQAKGLALDVDMEGVVTEDVVADKLRLEQVFLNILSNAVKFTPAGGSIGLRVIEKPSEQPHVARFQFRFKDNGIGMSKEFQEVIFDSFTRERSSTASGIDGTGLGMAITKSIIDMMGGTIAVNSAEGQGSEFVIDLDFKVSEKRTDSEPIRAGDLDFKGKRLLLAEDNEMNQQIATAILEEAGFTIDIAENGAKAVTMLEDAPSGYYDAVLMDIQMPLMDGYEASRRIRALDDDRKAAVPIIAMTANAFEEDRQAAFDAGMNGHVAKPYEISEIMSALARVL